MFWLLNKQIITNEREELSNIRETVTILKVTKFCNLGNCCCHYIEAVLTRLKSIILSYLACLSGLLC